jgi:hypothetical protein
MVSELPFVHSKSSRLISGSVALSGFLSNWEHTSEHELGDTTVLTDSGHTFTLGLDKGSLKLGGYTDTSAAVGGQDETLNTALGAAAGSVVTAAPEGFALGKRVINLEARESSYTTSSPVADTVSFASDWMSEGQLDCGVSLHDLSAETANGNSSSVDNAASSSNGGMGFVHVTAFSGLTNIIIKFQDSPDNSAWTDRITFATVTGVTSERKTMSGSVARYRRALWTVSGTGSATFVTGFCQR